MKCLFLYNPNSGKGNIAKKLPVIRRALEKKYDTVDIVATASGEDMTARSREGAKHYDAIVFSGGDGSFNRVLQGIGEHDVVLGYLPAGTVNDVATSLSLPKNLKRALRVITDGRQERVDCMLVNDEHYCMYIAAAGAFTRITYATPQRHKRALGKLAYAIEGLRHDMNLDVFPVGITCGKETFSASAVFVAVLNGRAVAGFPVNKQASMADGLLETAVITQREHPGFFRRIGAYFSVAALLLRGIGVRRRNLHALYGSEVQISTRDDVVWDFDGEKGICGNVRIRVLKGHVRMFVPKGKRI